MKKRKLLSLILAFIFILSCGAALAVPTAAETPAMPTSFPEGTSITKSKLWLDWTALGLNVSNAGLTVSDGMLNIDSGSFVYSGAGSNLLPEPNAWRGASGLMVYVDTDTAVNPNFLMCMLSDGGRPNNAGNASATGWTQITTIDPHYGGEVAAYYYKDSEWKTIRTSTKSGENFLNIGESFAGWMYVPLDSFWYRGGSGANLATDNAYGTRFSDFMTNFEKANIVRMAIQSETPGIKFGNVHLVYGTPTDMNVAYTTEPLFGTMAEAAKEGNAVGVISENSVTVAGMTENSGTVSASRQWINGISRTSLDGASGMRFYVDTTALDDGAALQLRLRLMSSAKLASTSSVYASGTGYMTSSEGWGNPQYVCRADNSVAYYYDEETAKPLYVQSDVSTNGEGDLFEALPENYKGYIYIPFESFWMSGISYNLMKCHLSFEKASPYYPIDKIAICHAISGTTTTDAVTYSNFELLYVDDPNTKMTGASITIDSGLNLNIYGTIGDTASDPKMQFTVGDSSVTVDGVLQNDGSYKFVYANVLPQTMGDTVGLTMMTKLGAHTVKRTADYSILEYCSNKLADSATPAELKTLLVDMLYYGEAAQKYASYKTDALVTKNLSDGEKALKSADTTASIAGGAEKSGTASEKYKWSSVSLKLEGVLSLKLKLQAASTVGLTADVTVNGRMVTYNQFSEASGTFVIVFNQLGVEEMDDEITLVLKVNGEATGETITCTAAAYIKEALNSAAVDDSVKSLLRAAYAYGQSVSSYAAA